MIIKLWKNFNKRKNSTKQPAEASAITLEVKLKEATSIEAPTFILQSSDFDYNYCQAFGHYYYIDNIIKVSNDLMQISCSQDLLATYKINILSTSAFIQYASTAYNKMLPDNRIGILPTLLKHESTLSVSQFSESGTYVLHVVNDRPGTTGFTAVYLTSASVIQRLASYLMIDLGTGASEILDWFNITFGDTYGSIISCSWIPLDLATAATRATLEQIYIGRDEVLPGGNPLTAYKVTSKAPITIVNGFASIGSLYTDDFRIAEPYTKARLYIPYYGMLDLNPIEIINGISITLSIDIVTGDTTAYISSDNKLLTTINYNMAVNCPIAQTSQNFGAGVASLAGGAGSAAIAVMSSGTSAVAATIGAVVGAANGVVDITKSTTSVKGNIQGYSMSHINSFKLEVNNIDTIDPDNLRVISGRPVMKVDLISNHSGYVKTVDASVNIAGLGNDKSVINGMLDAGIYLE